MTDKDSHKDLSDFSMTGLFRMELESQTAILNQGLLALEENPAAAENLESLMRASHSIKGAARIVQLDAAVELAHAMEDCFVAVQEGRVVFAEPHIDTLLQSVDIFTRISQVADAEIPGWLVEHQPEIDAAVRSLSGVREADSLPEAAETDAPAPAPAEPAPEPGPVPGMVESRPPGESQIQEGKPAAEPDVSVRVTAEKLNRLMGLAGEALVEVGRLPSFGASLHRFKKHLAHAAKVLDAARGSVERLDRNHPVRDLLDTVREKHRECASLLSDCMTDFDLHSRRMDHFSNRLYHEVVSCRMRPFGDGTQGFPRMVRDVAKKLGKKVKLEIVGKDTDIDRDMLEL